MKKKKTEKAKRSVSVAEIVVVAAAVVVAVVLCVSAILNFIQKKKEGESSDLPNETSAEESDSTVEEAVVSAFASLSVEEAVNSSEEFRPSSGFYTVFFPEEGTAAKVAYEELSLSGGYVYNEFSCVVEVSCSYGSGILAGYDRSLEEDVKQINMLDITNRLCFQSEDLERDFVNYVMSQRYEDVCFIDGGACKIFVPSGEYEAAELSSYLKVVVSDTLDEDVLALVEKFSGAQEIAFSDTGNYKTDEYGVWTKNYAFLYYAFPWIDSLSCPEQTYYLKEGSLRNAQKLASLSMPYTGASVSDCFSGNIPESLKEIVFTSALVPGIGRDIFDGCGSVESLTFCVGIQTYERGAFLPCVSLKEIVFAEDTLYYYGEELSGATIKAPASAEKR